ncbi:hypothetical protein QQF64_035386 [Cirrhinus molitorella]|uniref:Uncharacterized protein n=1 Tax=Cirrhinus molitorella TaxID=172907 RepID=A0ABR3NFM7_9TELE
MNTAPSLVRVVSVTLRYMNPLGSSSGGVVAVGSDMSRLITSPDRSRSITPAQVIIIASLVVPFVCFLFKHLF